MYMYILSFQVTTEGEMQSVEHTGTIDMMWSYCT